MIYAVDNQKRVEAEYNILDYIKGETKKEHLKKWVDDKYPGKWDKFIQILEGNNENKTL